jgi:hypothetical protein
MQDEIVEWRIMVQDRAAEQFAYGQAGKPPGKGLVEPQAARADMLGT